jgi:hypothetical protein
VAGRLSGKEDTIMRMKKVDDRHSEGWEEEKQVEMKFFRDEIGAQNLID